MGSLPPARRMLAKRICIVGAGPAGIAAAKFLKAEKSFDHIDIFEQRHNVGGIWDYTPEHAGDGMFKVPQVTPYVPLEKPVQSPGSGKPSVFLSPIYERLFTNIPKTLMRFHEVPFPSDIPLFPTHRQTQEYLERYSAGTLALVQFGTQVTEISLISHDVKDNFEQDRWLISRKDVLTGSKASSEYDAVIVASGHFSAPKIPDIKGLRDWHAKYPGSISHSKYYRLPEQYRDKKVVVIGNSASGLDIAGQIAPFAKAPLLQSSRSESFFGSGFNANTRIKEVPEITSFDTERGVIHFKDGTAESGVDHILFCTGYLYTLPFLHGMQPSPLTSDGSRLAHTYQHLFYAPRPSLTFMALPQKVIPFPISEVQAAAIARVYSGRLPLPSNDEMETWEHNHLVGAEDRGGFHTFKFPGDGEYINHLYDWALEAEPKAELENGGRGKLGGRWGPKEFWMRERFGDIRKAYAAKGDEKEKVTSLEELGFIFEKSDTDANSGRKQNAVGDDDGPPENL